MEISEDNAAAAALAFLRVIEGAPDNAALLLNCGVRLLALERPEAAAQACRQALALTPELAQAHCTLGRVHMRLEEPEAAAAAFARALRLDPGLHEALLNLATLRRRAGRLEEAEALYLRCREIDPSAWHHEAGLAALRQAEGRWSEAVAHFETALARQPGNYALLNDLGNVLQSAGRQDEALERYRQAARAAPDEPSPPFNAAALLFRIERYAEAIELFRGGVERWPDQSAAFTPLAHALLRECNWRNLGATVTRVMDLATREVAGDQEVTVSPFALYSLPVEAEALGVELARRISAQAAAAAPTAAPFLHDSTRQRPRLGYISPDFRAHSVGLAFRELLLAHDRERFEILGYGLTPDDDEPISRTLRQGFDGFRDLSQEGDLAAAQSYVQVSFDSAADTLNTNVIGTTNLLDAVRLSGLDPLIHICSSSEVYGQVNQDELPIRETNPLRPASPYAVSKVGEDMIAQQYFLSYGMRTLRTRMFTHTGPRRGDVFAESAFAKQIAEIEAGIRSDPVKVGNLDSVRTFADVRDAVRGYWLLLEKCPPGAVYNIGGERTMTVGEMLEMLKGMAKVPIEHEVDPALMRPSDVTLQIPDCSAFKAATGWQPEIALEQTLADLLDYQRARIKRRS
jgi:GDPmannose 4,6-dehydratase/GDP-4-dehydro-6-deoxy-D-mannose reductase